jgi:hypothetical protein
VSDAKTWAIGQELENDILKRPCPKCGAKAIYGCSDKAGKFIHAAHFERIALALPLPGDTLLALRGMLAGYDGQPSRAGDAFKVVDAALAEAKP